MAGRIRSRFGLTITDFSTAFDARRAEIALAQPQILVADVSDIVNEQWAGAGPVRLGLG